MVGMLMKRGINLKGISLSSIRMQMTLVGLCAVFVIASFFLKGRAFLALIAAALAIVFMLRLINLRRYPPVISLALSCLLGAILASAAWKKHWAVMAAFAAFIVLMGFIRYLKTPATPAAPGPPPLTGQ
jgi:hypothetical protein